MDDTCKQLLTELLSKIVTLEVQKKKLEEENEKLLAEITHLKKQMRTTSLFEELDKEYPFVEKIREEVFKNYPSLFSSKDTLERLRDRLGKNYPELTEAENISNLGKNFIMLLMKNILE
ncbi:Hypothetical protein BRZCDTV_506 [Brazilian cedratvirus IHUMI]|uniref:Uncharacterized protein n=1 Tax=Brazilian cedratvirus IHUMI TaxID=2126980 RepID=A0A2R8FFG7_9VIRU|nr:Hypothetical protein BRZCDTV_506 [Brazilian cedratvirus IHUMI]